MNQHGPQCLGVGPCQNLSRNLIAYVNRFAGSYHLLILDKGYILKTTECFVASGPCGLHSFPLKILKPRLGDMCP